MSAKYSNTSPYYLTPIKNNFNLDFLQIRSVSAEADDFLYTIEPQYTYRPDLLAYDLYGQAGLWWVFIQRNMNVLEDPIFDFIPGVQIYIPKNSSLKKVLGL
jgi:hypothetical protein